MTKTKVFSFHGQNGRHTEVPPDRFKDKSGGDKSTRDKKKPKGSEGEQCNIVLASFMSWWLSGMFSMVSLSMIFNVGLSVASALNAASKPIAGRVRHCLDSWRTITDSAWVRGVIEKGYKLQFSGALPPTPHRVKNLPTDAAATEVLDNEVEQMLAKQAIHIVKSSDDELVSCFFARPKKQPGKWRPIVSLKFLNQHLKYLKFKMTTITDVKRWVKEGHYFVSLDLTDAYFSVPISPTAWKYVRFLWKKVTYEFKVLMFGLGASPRVFTKVLKSVVKFLRLSFDIMILAYLDDFIIQAKDYETCMLHLELTILVFQCLGFEVNYAKSCLTPTKCIEHLGFIWNSTDMTIALPSLKVEKIITLATAFLEQGGFTADELRSFLGRLESVRPVVEQAALNYRSFQYALRPLRKGRWRGRKFIPLTRDTRRDLIWWCTVFPNPVHIIAPLNRGVCTVEFMADASGTHGWGVTAAGKNFARDCGQAEITCHTSTGKRFWQATSP